MNHTPEFSKSPNNEARAQAASELAACYARVFLGDKDGERVLADLRLKFAHDRPRFTGDNPNVITAAQIDGQCMVLKEIETAVNAGDHSVKPNPPAKV